MRREPSWIGSPQYLSSRLFDEGCEPRRTAGCIRYPESKRYPCMRPHHALALLALGLGPALGCGDEGNEPCAAQVGIVSLLPPPPNVADELRLTLCLEAQLDVQGCRVRRFGVEPDKGGEFITIATLVGPLPCSGYVNGELVVEPLRLVIRGSQTGAIRREFLTAQGDYTSSDGARGSASITVLPPSVPD